MKQNPLDQTCDCVAIESYTKLLLENSSDNIPSQSWPKQNSAGDTNTDRQRQWDWDRQSSTTDPASSATSCMSASTWFCGVVNVDDAHIVSSMTWDWTSRFSNCCSNRSISWDIYTVTSSITLQHCDSSLHSLHAFSCHWMGWVMTAGDVSSYTANALSAYTLHKYRQKSQLGLSVSVCPLLPLWRTKTYIN